MSKSRLFEIELEGKRLSVELSKRASRRKAQTIVHGNGAVF